MRILKSNLSSNAPINTIIAEATRYIRNSKVLGSQIKLAANTAANIEYHQSVALGSHGVYVHWACLLSPHQ
jgi:hypothetical protein